MPTSGSNRGLGAVLVQVLVMSVLFAFLAAAVLKLILGTHMLGAQMTRSTRYRAWVEACQARKIPLWQGNPCGGAAADSCDFTGEGGPVVNISCPGGATVNYTVSW